MPIDGEFSCSACLEMYLLYVFLLLYLHIYTIIIIHIEFIIVEIFKKDQVVHIKSSFSHRIQVNNSVLVSFSLSGQFGLVCYDSWHNHLDLYLCCTDSGSPQFCLPYRRRAPSEGRTSPCHRLR